jgi:hypothetical protein
MTILFEPDSEKKSKTKKRNRFAVKDKPLLVASAAR